jgi:PAS domain-containing protein/DNA-binding CsgD family transcriptional regulator
MEAEGRTRRDLVEELTSLRLRIAELEKAEMEKRHSEAALLELERHLALIIDFLPDATFAIDIYGKVIAWNKAVEELTGVAAENMLGRGDYEYAVAFYGVKRPIMIDLVLKADPAIEKTYESIIVKHKDTLIVENWVPHLRGERAFIWGKASPLYDGKGRIAGAIETVRDITDRKEAEEANQVRERELKIKTRELEDVNTALRVLLKQREDDQKDLEGKIVSNIKVLVLPHLEKLREQLQGRKAQTHLNILDANLREIVSPFVQKLSSKYINLTNREIEIANLIKEEKTTKEITEILHISESAVNIHRYRIRQKLKLTKKHNLKAYLASLA